MVLINFFSTHPTPQPHPRTPPSLTPVQSMQKDIGFFLSGNLTENITKANQTLQNEAGTLSSVSLRRIWTKLGGFLSYKPPGAP